MDSPSQPARKVPLRRRWHVPGGHMLLSLSLAALVAAAPQGGFVGHLPEGVPGLERWNKASGSAQLENGASIDYELYYDSGRADYELIRYRISGWDGGGGPPYSSNEKMQWQVHVKHHRRYECEPLPAGSCRWREMVKDTPEYKREVQVLMWVLSVHRQLLYDREAGQLR